MADVVNHGFGNSLEAIVATLDDVHALQNELGMILTEDRKRDSPSRQPTALPRDYHNDVPGTDSDDGGEDDPDRTIVVDSPERWLREAAGGTPQSSSSHGQRRGSPPLSRRGMATSQALTPSRQRLQRRLLVDMDSMGVDEVRVATAAPASIVRCEFGCGFCGDFNTVAVHEKGYCPRKSAQHNMPSAYPPSSALPPRSQPSPPNQTIGSSDSLGANAKQLQNLLAQCKATIAYMKTELAAERAGRVAAETKLRAAAMQIAAAGPYLEIATELNAMEKQGETATLERYQAIKRMLARRSETKLDTARHSNSYGLGGNSTEETARLSNAAPNVKSSTPRRPGSTGSMGVGQLANSPVVERILRGSAQNGNSLDLSGELSAVDIADDNVLADQVAGVPTSAAELARSARMQRMEEQEEHIRQWQQMQGGTASAATTITTTAAATSATATAATATSVTDADIELPASNTSKPPQPASKDTSNAAQALRRLTVAVKALPVGWEQATSRSTGEMYYVNEALGISQFERPTESLPSPPSKGSGRFKGEQRPSNSFLSDDEASDDERTVEGVDARPGMPGVKEGPDNNDENEHHNDVADIDEDTEVAAVTMGDTVEGDQHGLQPHPGLLQHAHLLDTSGFSVGNESTDTAGMLVAHSLKVSLAETGAAADNKPRTATASLGAGAPAAVADDNDSNDAMDNDDVAVQESMQDQETTETAEARNSDDGAEGSEVGGLLARSPEQAAKKPKRNALQLVQKAARRVQAEADDRIEEALVEGIWEGDGELGIAIKMRQETGDVVLAEVTPGMAAARMPQLKAGLVVASVNGRKIYGMMPLQVVALLKVNMGKRPLRIGFLPPGAAETVTGQLRDATANVAASSSVQQNATASSTSKLRKAALEIDVANPICQAFSKVLASSDPKLVRNSRELTHAGIEAALANTGYLQGPRVEWRKKQLALVMKSRLKGMSGPGNHKDLGLLEQQLAIRDFYQIHAPHKVSDAEVIIDTRRKRGTWQERPVLSPKQWQKLCEEMEAKYDEKPGGGASGCADVTGFIAIWSRLSGESLEDVGAAAAAANARSKGEEVPKGADPLQKLFDELDTNSNGSLDQAELNAAVQRLGGGDKKWKKETKAAIKNFVNDRPLRARLAIGGHFDVSGRTINFAEFCYVWGRLSGRDTVGAFATVSAN